MKICGLLCLLAPVAIGLRLFYMQTFQHDKFTTKAERAIYNYLAEDRLRGKILDVNGYFLAQSVRTHSCGISKRYVKDRNKTISFLSKTLGIPKERIKKKWRRNRNFFFVYVSPSSYRIIIIHYIKVCRAQFKFIVRSDYSTIIFFK